MYITDMYRGIIQESQWSGPGTYLRQRIDQYGLDKVVRHGRIWRLTYDGMARRTDAAAHAERDAGAARRAPHRCRTAGGATPRSSCSSSSRTSRSCRRSSSWRAPTSNQLGAHPRAVDARRPGVGRRGARARADGGSRSADPASRRSASARRSTRPAIASFGADYKALAKDADTDVVDAGADDAEHAQGGRRAAAHQGGARRRTRRKACSSSPTRSSIRRRTPGAAASAPSAPRRSRRTSRRRSTRARQSTRQLCFACHGDDGRGAPMPGGARRHDAGARRSRRHRASSGHQDYVIKTLLHGLTGPVNGTTYTEVMVPMGQSPDDWIAGDRLLRPQLVRQSRVAHRAGRRGARARRDRPDGRRLDDGRARSVAAEAAGRRSRLEADRQPQRGDCAANALSIQPWTSGARAAARHVVPDRAAAAGRADAKSSSSRAPSRLENEPAVPGAPTRTGLPAAGAAPRGRPRRRRRCPASRAHYQVQVSMDGTTWSKPVAEGKGTGSRTDATFAPAKARFVRITQTASAADAPWSARADRSRLRRQ